MDSTGAVDLYLMTKAIEECELLELRANEFGVLAAEKDAARRLELANDLEEIAERYLRRASK